MTLNEAHQAGEPEIDGVPQLGISRKCAIDAIERWSALLLELERFKTPDPATVRLGPAAVGAGVGKVIARWAVLQ